MDPACEELAELVERSASARATIERLQRELAAVTAEQAAIGDRLRMLGLDDDGKTRVDAIEQEEPTSVTGAVPKPKDHSALKAGAAGAGLTIGLVIIVLLAMNLAAPRPEVAATSGLTASAVATTSASPSRPVIVQPRDEIPSPPVVAAPAAESTSAQVPALVVVGASTAGHAGSAASPAVPATPPAGPAPAAIKAPPARDYGF